TTTAETGDNQATSTNETIIDTGQAIAVSNVLNVVNTNIINSNGFILFLSNLLGGGGDLDLREWLKQWSPADVLADECAGGCGDEGETAVTDTNQAEIHNEVVVHSSTGNNSAAGDTAAIQTGDAYAAANVINVANTNIVDSNYLLLTFNNFGDWQGDLVFPAWETFLELFGTEVSFSGGEVNNQNAATINNELELSAETGGNTASAAATSSIQTGDAVAVANVVNEVNQNLVGGGSLAVVLRLPGGWSGGIFGAPAELKWQSSGDGIRLIFDGAENGNSAGAEINNDNQAQIDNQVQVYALTGDNQVTGDEAAIIQTGAAYAAANVVNVANTNVLGRNWLLAIINILGHWQGNISFGRPDLWVGHYAQIENNTAQPGERVTFRYTVINNGDAPATEVELTGRFDPRFFDPFEAETTFTWPVPDLDPGESFDFTYQMTLKHEIATSVPEAGSEAEITSLESDNNDADNLDSLLIALNHPVATNHLRRIPKERYAKPPEIIVTKTASMVAAALGQTITYTITVLNKGGNDVTEAKLADAIVNENEEIVSQKFWDLGTVLEDEEITVTYDVIFNASSPPGFYRNGAQLIAGDYASGIASTTVLVYAPAPVAPVAPTTPSAVEATSTVTNAEPAPPVTALPPPGPPSQLAAVGVIGLDDLLILSLISLSVFFVKFLLETDLKIFGPWPIKGYLAKLATIKSLFF
ncbi:MAG: hypothetical protein COV09_01075, partial [Candidatus Vogelbacteria bacterium CG10_big_fil_rev_8_21_14_0_10_50_13]